MDAVALVRDEVRDAVRRHGIDPVTDPDAVRALVDERMHAYRERSLDGALPALGEHESVAQSVYASVAGFGALQRHFDDPEVEEIWVNEPGRVFVARQGRSELTTTVLNEIEVRELVERMLKSSGRRVDVSSPFVDATLPDGSRLHVVIPDVTSTHWAVNIRKFVARADRLDDLVELGTITPQAARFLGASVACGLNVIVAGGTQAGKTTLLGCLLAAVPPGERVVSCEEVFELQLGIPDWVAMQTRQPSLEGTGEIRLRRLVKEALRMRPSRIVGREIEGCETSATARLGSALPPETRTSVERDGAHLLAGSQMSPGPLRQMAGCSFERYRMSDPRVSGRPEAGLVHRTYALPNLIRPECGPCPRRTAKTSGH